MTWLNLLCFLFFTLLKTTLGISRGVGLAEHLCEDATNLNVSWFYTWDWAHPCPGEINIDWIPMIFSQDQIGFAPQLKGKNYTALLGFNEPNEPSQADMTVDVALDNWSAMMDVGIPLGSPAVSQWNNGPWIWTRDFMAGVKERGYRVDFMVFHYYVPPPPNNNIENLDIFLNNITSIYPDYKIWITETSNCSANIINTLQDNINFLEQAYTVFKKYPQIERFAWFTNRWDDPSNDPGYDLIDSTTEKPNILGTTFASYPK